MRPEDTVEVVVAMADGVKLVSAHELALEAKSYKADGTGRRRGTRGAHRG